ncbi:MAG: 2-amino-4-hydroxy-6-hydroxymethyldihydropteridine diphosphokinase [Chlorobi bacterium]|nr:2-amino-4-hydroxy-6-hydroxymethyldihydropteridine diphosphokinase [Chlorobiota bacterium]
MPLAYLSLGANTGRKRENILHALKELDKRAGTVRAVSPAYRSPAWGFDGAPFVNVTAALDTPLEPEALLDVIHTLEKEAGRRRSGRGYDNRPLDIDILTYGDLVVQTERLRIPHPLLHKRRFVLRPWYDIAPDFRVPGFDKTVGELLSLCDDSTPVIRMSEQSELTPIPFDFIVFEGNIGAGKTTLATMLADEYGAKLITERFEENPFLPKFYEDPKRYAFPLEMSFLADRYQQLIDELTSPDLFSPFTVSDYYVIKSLIFAGVTLEDEEYELYRKIFNIMYRDIKKPDLYVYLYRTTDDLLKNIAKRGREYEKNITADYLKSVHEGYMKFIRSQRELNVLILDITGVDFVANPGYYRTIKDIIAHTPKTPETRRIKIEADE